MSAWPPKNGVTTPFISRKDAAIAAHKTIRIAAPAAVVFDALINISEYPAWNQNFCPECTIVTSPSDDKTRLARGAKASFKFNFIEGEKPAAAECEITDVSTPESPSDYVPADVLEKDGTYTADLSKVYRLAWRQEGGKMKSERFHEVIVVGENECELHAWVCYAGMLVKALKFGGFGTKIEEKMQVYIEGIKKRGEQLAGNAA